ncbi:MAG: sulfotransferase [Candidatus Nealsonbacteria bacterium]
MKNNFKVDYIGIGTHRAATSWIQQCLVEHPQVCGSRNKELSFLNDKNKYGKGIGAYEECFPNYKEGQIRGEFTPHYFQSEEAIQMIKNWFPNAKFIVAFRNPMERAYDHYIQHKADEKTMANTFEEAIKDRDLKPYYIDIGFYCAQFKKWLEVFPRENFIVLIYEEMIKDQLKYIQEIYGFLGIDSAFIPPSAEKEVNWPAKNAVKIPRLNFLIMKTKRFLYHHTKLFKPVVFLLKLFKIHRLVEIIRRANYRKQTATGGRIRYEKPPMPEKTRQYLRELYQEDIKGLEKLINRDLSLWQ